MKESMPWVEDKSIDAGNPVLKSPVRQQCLGILIHGDLYE
jgi:hypothetical protein